MIILPRFNNTSPTGRLEASLHQLTRERGSRSWSPAARRVSMAYVQHQGKPL